MRVITRFVWTRRGLRLWQEDLAQAERDGWQLTEHQVGTGLFGLRWLLVATLTRQSAPALAAFDADPSAGGAP